MEFDAARQLACARFLEAIPSGAPPDWFESAVTVGGFRSKEGVWTINLTLCPTQSLPEGCRWERINGRRKIVREDPTTGKVSVVISWTSPIAPITVFSAKVDQNTGKVTVVQNSDVYTLEEGDFEKLVDPTL